ncbi:MAG: DNA replication/repair protein RecF [Myxococcales bacterium]|nr:DNA replication/repair protein RecF [Myxococcales bacterium]
MEQLELRGFRNLLPLVFEPGGRFNVIHGDNGQGKSNLLEAIDYLGRLKSFRGATTEELIGGEAQAADLRARFANEPLSRNVHIHLPRQGRRQCVVDGKRMRSRSEYAAQQQIVLFHAGDLRLATGSPEGRRAFLDRMLEQFDPSYASSLAAYERALRSRNRLLKLESPKRAAIAAYDELLASAGAVIGQSRARLVLEMAPSVARTFEEISQQQMHLELAYAPRVQPEVERIKATLAAALPKDLARGFTADGPHADDLQFKTRGVQAKRFASQGQHRAIVLALKVTELHELGRRVGRVPVLLLDDVSSELDRTRNRLLFERLSSLGGQVFLTTTHPEFILIEHDRLDFRIEAGGVSVTR